VIARRTIDVSELPETSVIIHRDPLYWGINSLIAIEGTMFALLTASYYYLRGNHQVWPPTGVVQPALWITTTMAAILLLSCIPMGIVFHLAGPSSFLDEHLHQKKPILRKLQWWMVVNCLVNFVALGFRYMEFDQMQYRWNSHAYGSLVWGFLAMHTLHLITSTGENIMLTAVLFKGPVEKKLMPDLRFNALYWFFVALVWMPIYGIIFLDSAFFRNSM
jgi:cytochrome c oxidase subunit III